MKMQGKKEVFLPPFASSLYLPPFRLEQCFQSLQLLQQQPPAAALSLTYKPRTALWFLFKTGVLTLTRLHRVYSSLQGFFCLFLKERSADLSTVEETKTLANTSAAVITPVWYWYFVNENVKHASIIWCCSLNLAESCGCAIDRGGKSASNYWDPPRKSL